MKTKTKIYLTAICLFFASVSGCCYNLLSNNKPSKDAIGEGLEGAINAVEMIRENAANQPD